MVKMWILYAKRIQNLMQLILIILAVECCYDGVCIWSLVYLLVNGSGNDPCLVRGNADQDVLWN